MFATSACPCTMPVVIRIKFKIPRARVSTRPSESTISLWSTSALLVLVRAPVSSTLLYHYGQLQYQNMLVRARVPPQFTKITSFIAVSSNTASSPPSTRLFSAPAVVQEQRKNPLHLKKREHTYFPNPLRQMLVRALLNPQSPKTTLISFNIPHARASSAPTLPPKHSHRF